MKVALVGISAEGPRVLIELLSIGESLRIPVVVALHNIPSQDEHLVEVLSRETGQKVTLVKGRTKITPGVFVSQGGRDLVFTSSNTLATVSPSKNVAPSVDALFASAARFLKKGAVAFLFGGLGSDGSEGLLELEKAGANIYIQSSAKFPYMTDNAKKRLHRYTEVSAVGMKNVLKLLNREDGR